MKITSIPLDKAVSDGPIDAFSHALLGDSPTLDEVLEYLASRHAADPRYRYLCTLDDVGQCRYTSMHASDDARIALYEDEDPETPKVHWRHASVCWRMWSRSSSIPLIGWNGARWRAR